MSAGKAQQLCQRDPDRFRDGYRLVFRPVHEHMDEITEGAGFILALAENPHPVGDRTVAQFVHPQAGFDPVGIGNGFAVLATGIHHESHKDRKNKAPFR